MQNNYINFIKSHNLVNRIYDMLFYFGTLKDEKNEKTIKKFFVKKLDDIEYVETLAKYFERKLKQYKDKVEIKCNLLDLINDLNYLKQYLL